MENDPKQNRPTWQATKAAETRQRILDSALEVITEKGVSSLTLDAIVQQSGITKGGLQYHFASKEALAFGLLQEATVTFLNDVARGTGSDAPTDHEWTRSLIHYAFADDASKVGHWKPLVEMLRYSGDVKTLGESFYGEIIHHLMGAGLSRGVAMTLMMALEGYSTSPSDLPPDTGGLLREHFLQLLEQTKENK